MVSVACKSRAQGASINPTSPKLQSTTKSSTVAGSVVYSMPSLPPSAIRLVCAAVCTSSEVEKPARVHNSWTLVCCLGTGARVVRGSVRSSRVVTMPCTFGLDGFCCTSKRLVRAWRAVSETSFAPKSPCQPSS